MGWFSAIKFMNKTIQRYILTTRNQHKYTCQTATSIPLFPELHTRALYTVSSYCQYVSILSVISIVEGKYWYKAVWWAFKYFRNCQRKSIMVIIKRQSVTTNPSNRKALDAFRNPSADYYICIYVQSMYPKVCEDSDMMSNDSCSSTHIPCFLECYGMTSTNHGS